MDRASTSGRFRSRTARFLRSPANILLLVPLALVAWNAGFVRAEPAVVIPPPAVDSAAPSADTETAVLAGGCFWGVQAVFQHTKGVKAAVSGYAGGEEADPTYAEVSSGSTGHAEAVEVTFDPAEISYGEILRIYFSVAHDPTQLNRQGPDIGTQYRSAIFTTSAEQERIARAYIGQLDEAGTYGSPIVTEVEALTAFHRAEDYHQDYATLHPGSPYIIFHDLPKIEALQQHFPDRYREEPVLVFGGQSG